MLDAYQSENDLLFIKNFHVHRARANIVSFFRSLLISLFGRVDPKLSVYIPDVDKFIDTRTNRSVYRFSDVETSLVNILKWWEEEKRAVPYVIIQPGPLQEKKVEFSGDNLHFIDGTKKVFGSQAETNVTFLVGAEDDSSRTELADILYSSVSQFYRKNYLFHDLDYSASYALMINNDSVKMSNDGVIEVSQFEKLFTVAVQCNILLDWQFEVDMQLVSSTHLDTDHSYYDPVPEPSSLVDWVELDFEEQLTDQDRQDIHEIMTFIFLQLDDLNDKGNIEKTVEAKSDIISPDEGQQFITLDNDNLVVYLEGSFIDYTPIHGWKVVNIETGYSMIYLTSHWVTDKWAILS